MNLTISPAFGFETNQCNCKNNYENEYKKNKDLQFAKYKQTLEIVKDQSLIEKARQKNDKVKNFSAPLFADQAVKSSNLRKVVGYIPLIGSIAGVTRILNAITNQQSLSHKVTHIIRGMLEFLNLGFLLIIPDLILTTSKPGKVEFCSPLVTIVESDGTKKTEEEKRKGFEDGIRKFFQDGVHLQWD